MKSDLQPLLSLVRSAAPPDLELAFRHMFGGIMFYARGQPVALIWRNGLALKLTGDDHAEFAAIPGAAPWVYAPGKPASTSYIMAPETMLLDREALRGWIARAAAGAGPVSPTRSRKRGPRR
jgi:TfoX/Sxy family transcriptional regulator of competence genes